MVMEATPAAAFEMIEPKLIFQFLVAKAASENN
jgi:hypothetical protein